MDLLHNNMTENSIDYLYEEEQQLEEAPKEEDKPDFLEGICSKCLNSGFVHDVKNGVLGVCYTTLTEDSAGHPIKKLMVCTHGKQTSI